jgi:Uma2 family endonuclease
LILANVSWPGYVRMLRGVEGQRLRLTYDRGVLEIMTLSPQHERCKHLLGQLVVALAEELGLDLAGFGSMTCRRRRRRRGLEPDECFYVQNEPAVRGRDHLDLRRDPPPDLALEIEVSRSVLDRLTIYARLAVPEVWRWDGSGPVRWLALDAAGHYAEVAQSRAFPMLPAGELERFLAMRTASSETRLLQAWRQWVRDQIARGWRP